MTLTQAGLCEGYGGLSRAVTEVLGAELVWYSEIDPAACQVLEHHHPNLSNVGDLTRAWPAIGPLTREAQDIEPVDILTGGWPCQPWSPAGKRKGAADERAIWPHVARAVCALRPRLVVLENVARIAAAGELARAVGDLAALGYVGSWRRVRASDVGAPHQRARIFIVARPATTDPTDIGHERGRTARRRGTRSTHRGHNDSHPAGIGRRSPRRNDGVRAAGLEPRSVADTPCVGWSGRDQSQPDLVGDGPEPSYAGSSGGDWAGYEPAIRRWEAVTGRRAPSPTVLSSRGNHQLSARFAEWLMGLPNGHVTDVPGITRNAQLKLCGNGVVPQQAAHALRLMLAADSGRLAA